MLLELLVSWRFWELLVGLVAPVAPRCRRHLQQLNLMPVAEPIQLPNI